MTSKNEKNILFRLKKKDKDAFAEVYDLYVDQIYRFIYFKIGSKEEAEDLTSAVFLKTWNYIRVSEVEETTLKALIYKIARNIIIDQYRKKSLRDEVPITDENENFINIKDDRQNLSEQFDQAIEKEAVLAKLSELKDEYREMIVLRYIEDLSIGEIAEIQGKKRGTVRVEAHRALRALKNLFGSEKNNNK